MMTISMRRCNTRRLARLLSDSLGAVALMRRFATSGSLFYRPQFHGWVALVVSGLALATFRLKTAGTALCYPLMAGGLGGCTTLCAKLVGELGKASAPWHVAATVGICIPCFAVLKIDLEGYEVPGLRGAMSSVLAGSCPPCPVPRALCPVP